MNKNEAYGGFLISKNILNGIPIQYSYREESSIKELNGWNLLSKDDDDEYVNNVDNFVIVNAESIYKLAPVMLEIFDAPYGTDLFWVYDNDVHIGFYDLKKEENVTIEQILS